MPKGTVHQAIAQPAGDGSAHLTLSTYHRWALADLLAILLDSASQGAPS